MPLAHTQRPAIVLYVQNLIRQPVKCEQNQDAQAVAECRPTGFQQS